MKTRLTLLLLFLASPLVVAADDDLPGVPDGFVVDVVAKEPMVSNPCVMAFDSLGQLCVAQGPQWRGPTPETPGDRVDILIDNNGDGIADSRKTFAEGFNSVQGIAWHGHDLWVANAPDLTVVRDTDGDDEADEYLRVYTGLGNLEHSLHGLNFGPDGKLYMSKGNSKGYNRLDQLAPKAFRELWGLPSPKGAPDYTPVEKFTKQTYRRKYHTPQDDWGQQGGILRCDPNPVARVSSPSNKDSGQVKNLSYGRNLEIFSRGFRNPWDITFDDGFNWLGTDNDQTQGDRIFAPSYGSHFGWGHPWSFHWAGEDHLPTVPNSAGLFEGSGAGVIHYRAKQFPKDYHNVFFVNDWLRREIYAFRPKWHGALMKCENDFPPVFAHVNGGRSLPSSSGRVFEPTDIEVGPDGALYVLSWGHGYGANMKDGNQLDAGRVYRIRFAKNPLAKWNGDHRSKPPGDWSLEQLFADLGSDIPAWRVNAQNELLRRKESAKVYLLKKLIESEITKAEETWSLWTLGRMSEDQKTDDYFAKLAFDETASLNSRTQAVRLLAHRVRRYEKKTELPKVVGELLTSGEPRLRHEAVQAIWQASQKQHVDDLLDLIAKEQDPIIFYSAWNALRELAPLSQRKEWLEDSHASVRLATLLGLFYDDQISGEEAMKFRDDSDSRVAGLTNNWLEKTGKGAPLVQFDPPPGEYVGVVNVGLKTSVGGAFLTYTLDGSRPSFTSPRVAGPIRIDRSATLRVAVNTGNTGGSQLAHADYEIRHVQPYRHREFVTDVKTPSSRHYEIDWTGLAVGKRYYTDREYSITNIPAEVMGLPFLRAANNDDRSTGNNWLTLTTTEDCDLIVGVDARNKEPLAWMKIGEKGGFEETGLTLSTTDPVFRLYRKHFSAGKIVLGGNTNDPKTDNGRGNYLVVFDRQILSKHVESKAATIAQALAKMKTADPVRGRELFLHPRGAGCFKCHRMEGIGGVFAPDLSDIGTRAKTPRVLIESILQPSKVITEGFAQQKVLTSDGKIYSGAIVEESGRSIKLVNSDAVATVIQKADIEERTGSKLSPMPNGFGKIMSPQQVADLTAWLLTQKVVGDPKGFSFRDRKDQLEIHFGEQRIATYLKRHDHLTRRALVNVTTPGGIQVTRNFPPRKPEDIDPGYNAESGIIHPHMHPGIWLSFGDVDGNDYWRLKAKVVFDGFIKSPAGDKASGSFSVKNRFMSKDGKRMVCNEVTHYRFDRVSEGLLLKIVAEYQSSENDFYFGDQEESGLAVRVASPIRVQGGNGTIINDRGEKNGAQVWGKEAKWFDYFGEIDGQQVGVMVVPNPQNPRPSWLHARDYGVIVTNPFHKQPKERREPYVKTHVKRGETFRLSYAILIHEAPADKPLNPTETAETLLKSFN